MPLPKPGVRIAISQVQMHWTIEENVASMLWAMEVAHTSGARLCAFSELALTGFHRKIVELAKPELVAPAMERITRFARELHMAVTFGAPTFGPNGARYNSHVLVNESGDIAAVVHKNGLTEPEATFFQAGASRPAASLHGLATTAVICREVEDFGPVVEQLSAERPELILWPGLMGPDPSKPVTDPPEHVVQAQRIASAAKAFIVQSNWPNALNNPVRNAGTGLSACISEEGELLFRLPEQAYGVGVCTLGEPSFEWHASEA
jgi:omega-amidase